MVRLTDKILEKLPQPFFTTRDVMNLLGGSKDRRYALVKRAIAAGEILHIRRGLYVLTPKPHVSEVSPLVLAQHVYGPSYISLESALRYHNWIPEGVYAITSVSRKKSTRFETPLGLFTYDSVPQEIFYTQVERLGNSGEAGVLMASPLKALADFIYVYKKDWTGIAAVQGSLRVDREDMSRIKPSEVDDLMENYRSQRVKRFLSGIKKDLGL